MVEQESSPNFEIFLIDHVVLPISSDAVVAASSTLAGYCSRSGTMRQSHRIDPPVVGPVRTGYLVPLSLVPILVPADLILPPLPGTRYTRQVIQLDDHHEGRPVAPDDAGEPPAPHLSKIADPDWFGVSSDALMLYLANEPAIGEVFTYHGLRWQVVDYHDGWVARLVID